MGSRTRGSHPVVSDPNRSVQDGRREGSLVGLSSSGEEVCRGGGQQAPSSARVGEGTVRRIGGASDRFSEESDR